MENKAQGATSGNEIIAFGDIHGCIGAATTAIRIAEEMNCKAVFLGDYVDRGSNSIGVLETIAQARVNHPEWIFLAGNHDVMLLDLIAGKRHPEQFDERTYKESFCEYQSLESAKKREIARLLHCLETFYESSSYIFLHGGFLSSEPDIEHISKDEIVWTYDIPLKYAGKKMYAVTIRSILLCWKPTTSTSIPNAVTEVF